METSAEPSWVSLKDEEMLALRICDLGVRLQGSELEPRVNQLFDDLAARGVTLRPDCYLADEWFSPDGVPAIAIRSGPRHLRYALSLTFALPCLGPHYCVRNAENEPKVSTTGREINRSRWPAPAAGACQRGCAGAAATAN